MSKNHDSRKNTKKKPAKTKQEKKQAKLAKQQDKWGQPGLIQKTA